MRYRLPAFVLAVVAAMLAPTAIPAAPEIRSKPIPIEAFADAPIFDAPVISPDGARFAARAVVEGKSRVLIYPALLDGPARAVDLGSYELASIHWAGNDRLLLGVQQPMTLLSRPVKRPRLVAIDLVTGKQRLLDGDSRGLFSDLLYVHPSGAWLLIASQDDITFHPSVKRIDIATGATKTIEGPRVDVWNWFTDDSGVTRAGIAYTGGRWTMWYRPNATAPLSKLRGRVAANGEEGSVDSLNFLATSGDGIIVTNARTERFGAYRYDFANGQIGAPIYENAKVDVSSVRVGRGGNLEGIAYTDDRDRTYWLDARLAKIQALVDKVLPKTDNALLNSSDDGQRTIIWSHAADDPGTYYLYDAPTRQLRPLVSPYATLEGAHLAAVAPIHYAARDGLDIPGYLTLPPGREPRGLPLIVLPHGGPHARDDWSFDAQVQFLASRGYAVLQPNFRGSTGYGRDFVERGYGQWGRAMQDDIDDGIAWLAKSGTIDRKRVCILGASYGGYAALWGAIRSPQAYRCAVSIAGVTDIPALLRYDQRLFAPGRYYREWERKIRGLEKLDLAAVSPLEQADRLTLPVLIAHGENDDVVPPIQSRELIKALKQNKKVESVFYPGEGHSFLKRENKLDLLRRIEAFLAKYNPA